MGRFPGLSRLALNVSLRKGTEGHSVTTTEGDVRTEQRKRQEGAMSQGMQL